MKRLIAMLALLALCGCANLNTTAFNAEKLLADTGTGSVHSYNVYYQQATNGATAAKIDSLNKERDQIYDASQKLAAVLAVAETARLAYATNQTPATKAALQLSMSALSANSGAVTGAVANAMAPFSTLK